MTQLTAANLAAEAAAAQANQAPSEQVEALVAGAANTVTEREPQPAGQTQSH